MSVKLNMSQNLAGLTLLAFGNQVADITVAIVSCGEENGGIEASLSTILGADSLVIGFVMPTVIFLGNGVIVKGQNFTRDLLTYLVALILIFSIGIFSRKLNLIYAFIIFGLYIVYVGLCIIMERIENNKKSSKEKLIKKERNENESVDRDTQHDFKVKLFEDDEEKGNQNDSKDENDSIDKKDETEQNNKDKEKNKEEKDNENKEEKKNEKKDNKEDKKGKKKDKKEEDKSEGVLDLLSDKMSLIEDVASLGGPVKFNINDFITDKYYLKKSDETDQLQRQTSILIQEHRLVYNRLHYTLAKYYLNSKEEKWSEISFFKKIIKIFVEFPLNLVRDLTTPPFEKEKWKKEFFAAMPVSISLCLSLFFKLFPYYIKFPHFIFIAVYYILAIIFCIYLYKRSYRGSLPKCEWVLLLSALIMSMIWIYTVTTILIQMVNDSQYLLPFEISKSFLIMTVLALGNALPDFLIDCTLSTSGYAEMALSGTIGSPVFSLLFGFGLSLIKNFSLAENKEQAFDLLTFTPSTKVILCAMGGIFINLVHYMLIFSLVNYKVKRYVSYAGFCVFFAYLVSIVLVSFVFV
jgi:Ca2+/Na+ antiporter